MNDPKVEKQKPVPPFVQFCCAAVPMVFDDSLSYYEALCAMWKYLNDTVNVINNNAMVTEDTVAKMDELKKYVDDYFINLDVQTEINKKLDQMALDGSLAAVIGVYCQPLIDDQNNTINQFKNDVNAEISGFESRTTSAVNDINAQVQSLAEGSPLVASSVDDMTDTTRIYVNTSDGKWYYYDGDSWEIGGTYQATQIDVLSIIGSLIKDNTITNEKLRDVVNILGKATAIYRGKAVTGYTSGGGVSMSDNIVTNVAVFNTNDVKDYTVFYKVDNTTTTGGTAIRVIGYNSSDGTDVSNATLSQLITAGTWYDSENGCLILQKYGDTKDTIYVTLNANFDIFIKPLYEKKPLVAGDSIKIKSVDMRNYGAITYGRYGTGFNVSTYLPNENNSWPMNKLLITLTSDNIQRVLNSYLYLPSTTSNFTKRIIVYKENIRADSYNLSNLIQSAGYNSVTKRVHLGTVLGDTLNQYDYIAIYFEESIKEVPLYSTYLTENDPNYDLLDNKFSNFDILLPKNIKCVEDQQLCVYFQNIVRYQNIDTLAVKEIQDAFLNNDRMSILDSSNTGSYTKTFTIKNSYKGDSIFKTFNYQVIAGNAGGTSTKKILMIGDSLTEAGKYTKRLLDLFADDTMNVTLLGSMYSGTETNRFEGRGGWSTADYMTNSTKGGYTNPFYNSSTQTFDFSYYMTEQGYTDVDYVFINLGTNDYETGEATLVSNIQAMVDSIHDFDADIKVCLWLPPNRGITDENLVSNLNHQFKYAEINRIYLDNFEDSEDLYLVPVNLNVNPYKDFAITNITISDDATDPYTVEYTDISHAVHPQTNGYYHIGDVIYTWIKYLASL